MDYSRMTAPTVLVVDDDALINIGTADMVQDMGFRTLEAYSGAEALTLLSSDESVGVLITDYSMPGMNGLELARQALALRPHLQVVLATGYNDLPSGEVCDLPRLSKPFRDGDLKAYLKSVTDLPE